MKRTLILLLLMVVCYVQTHAFLLQYGEKGMVFAWQSTDYVGLLTESSTQMRYGISSIAEDEHCASLFSAGWSLKQDVTYYAYAPFNPQYSIAESHASSLLADFSVQQQTGNGNTDHLSQHAFYVGNVRVNAETPDATIHLHPLTAVVRFTRKFDVPVTLKKVQLSVDDHLIPLLGTVNLLEESFTPLGYAKTITLDIEDIQVSEGEDVAVYLTLPSCNLEGHTIMITYTATDGTCYEQSVDGFDICSGSTYCIGATATATEPQTYTPETNGTKDAPMAVACDLPIAGTYIPTDIRTLKTDVANDEPCDLLGRRTQGGQRGIMIYKGKKILKRKA